MAPRLPKRTRPHVTRGPARARQPRARLASREHRSAAAAAAARISPLLRFTRHGIAALAVLAGVVAMAFGTPTSLVGGAALIGAGISSWLVAWLYRIGVAGDEARQAEERARDFYDR